VANLAMRREIRFAKNVIYLGARNQVRVNQSRHPNPIREPVLMNR